MAPAVDRQMALDVCAVRSLGVFLSAAVNFSFDLDLCNLSSSSYVRGDNFFEDGEFDALKRFPFVAVAVVLCVMVTVTGSLGNTLVVVTVATTAKLRTATNIFIANLAIADIFVCAFDLPLNLFYLVTDHWPYGRTLCHVIPACFGVVVYASTLSMTMIAVDRFVLIVMRNRRRITPTVAVILVFVIGVISGAVASPIGIYSRHVRLEDPAIQLRRSHCVELWPSLRIRRLYSVLTLAIQFVIPLTVIAVLYFLIFWKVRATRKLVKNKNRKKKSKTNRMLVAVVSVFVISWIPYQILSIASEFHANLYSEYFKFIDLLLRMLAMSSSCVNPFLYGWMNDAFRSAFLSIIRRRRVPKTPPTINPTTDERDNRPPGAEDSGAAGAGATSTSSAASKRKAPKAGEKFLEPKSVDEIEASFA